MNCLPFNYSLFGHAGTKLPYDQAQTISRSTVRTHSLTQAMPRTPTTAFIFTRSFFFLFNNYTLLII